MAIRRRAPAAAPRALRNDRISRPIRRGGLGPDLAEALSDDGSLTGRGRPVLRGAVTGLMTAAGGIGHTLPFLIKDFHVAFIAAVIVVAMELATIAWIRNRYMDTPLLSAAFQVVVGGVLVFAVGIWIGSS